MKDLSVLICFQRRLPRGWASSYDVVIASSTLRSAVEGAGKQWVVIDDLIQPGSIYEASTLLEELSRVKNGEDVRVAKSFLYKGYELWWINYSTLFIYFCLPYTRYKKLLEHIRSFKNIYLHEPPHKNLFLCYLKAYGSNVVVLHEYRLRKFFFLNVGMLFQILFTLFSVLMLVVSRPSALLFVGDRLEKGADHDARVKFIYEALRKGCRIQCVEFIRSLQPWRIVIGHAWVRKRPVVYSEAVISMARFLAHISGGYRRARECFTDSTVPAFASADERFKYNISIQYLLAVYEDIWAIRIMAFILRIIGIRAAIVPTAAERTFHAVLGCKLNNIPTVGILHGVASRFYNHYDFMPGYDGEKHIALDKYGVWSEWWKEYYLKHSKVYREEHLHVSGPMRPLQALSAQSPRVTSSNQGRVNVLLVSEIVAVPTEITPYLDALLSVPDFSVHIKFRPQDDSFEAWLKKNRPDILEAVGQEWILKGGMHDAIARCDVVVGSQSTGVIEAALHEKPFVFFNTKKWGDYYDLRSLDTNYHFFAENPKELIQYIRESGNVPASVLKDFCTQFFGDSHQNGSAWVVDQIEAFLQHR